MRRILAVSHVLSVCMFVTFVCPQLSDAALKELHPKIKKLQPLQAYTDAPAPAEKDVPALTRKADSGDTAAKNALARYRFESGDIDGAAKLLKQPAENGDAEAQFLYAFTIGGSGYALRDDALAWLRKSAAQNYVPALSFLAGNVKPEEAVGLLRKAASMGDAQSAQALGDLYLVGREVAHDGVAAYAWLYLARHGYTTPAQTERPVDDSAYNSPLNFLAWTMTLEEIKQVEAALATWPKSPPPEIPFAAASSGHGQRRMRAAVPLLSPGAIAALKAKADAGDSDARLRLGTMALNGRYVKKDPPGGIALIKQAAESGNENALFSLAELYQDSHESLEKNMPEARKIYENLAAKGNPRAQVALGQLLLKSDYEYPRDKKEMEKDAKSAVEWFTKAARQNDPNAMAVLAKHYDYRERNSKLAASWFEKSASLGNMSALTDLLGIAEQSRSSEDIYKWTSAYMSVLPPSDRQNSRQIMMQFAGGLSDDDVLRLKKSVAAWLKKSPKLMEAARANVQNDKEAVRGGDEFGRTPLHVASEKGDLDAMRPLLHTKTDVNSQDYHGFTPLHLAIIAGKLDTAKLLLQAGAIIDAQAGFGETPLTIAVKGGNAESVSFLLNAKANPDISNPLLLSVEGKKPDIAALLIKAGADCNVPDHLNQRALHHAVHESNDANDAMLGALLQAGADCNVRNTHGQTPLYAAIEAKNVHAAKVLLAAKADPNLEDNRQNTPLNRALAKNLDDIAVLLLNAGAKGTIRNKEGKDALYAAVSGNKPEVAKTLLKAGADADAAYSGREDPLLFIAKTPELAAVLLEAKADPNKTNNRGYAPLHEAADKGRAEIARMLLQAGADPNKATTGGYTPLHLVFLRGDINFDILKMLLEAGADPNVRGEHVSPPLHQAARKGNLDAMNILLAAKADPNFADSKGRSTLDVATNPAAIAILEKAGGKSAKADEVAQYDELGRPMNKAAELAEANRNKPGAPKKKAVHVSINSPKEAEEFNKTLAEERKGNRTPYLARAVMMDVGQKELVERIKAGADPNAEDPVFGFALVQAIAQRRGEATVRTLLENGADPNKGTPLLEAIRYSDEIGVMLLKAGADPMAVDYEKTPVLIRAAKNNKKDTVAALLRAGAKPDAKDKDGYPALYHALDRDRDAEMVQLLLDNGASVKTFPALLALKWDKKNIPTALVLLKHGASARVGKDEGDTLVHWAVRDGSVELLHAAHKAGTSVTSPDREGTTPLCRAVWMGDAAMVAALIKAGAPVNKSAIRPGAKFRDYDGNIVAAEDDLLAQAVREGNVDVVTVLVKAKVNLNARENRSDRHTPLHKAVAKGYSEIAAVLLDAGANPNIGDRYKRTPLHSAVRKKDTQTVAALLAKKADPGAADEDGETPLHEAARRGNAEAVRLLLEAGADPNLKDKNGRTPLDAARDDATAALLEKAGAKRTRE